MTDGKRCTREFTVPKSVPTGRVLAHNPVRHTINTLCGANGFRSWTWPIENKPDHFVPCDCGYAGLPHYKNGSWDEYK
jgi:hypothetical protein